MLQITNTNDPSFLVSQKKRNYNILNDTTSNTDDDGVSRSIENLSTIINLSKYKRPNLTKSKKEKNLEFVTTNSFGTDFLILEVKKTFIQL